MNGEKRQKRRLKSPQILQTFIMQLRMSILLSIEFILDILNCLKNSGCVIEYIKDRLLLLAKAEGLVDIVKKDIANTSVRLEKIVFAIGSLLVTEDDFDDVQCWFCGNCPKFVSTDGNTKVGVRNHRLIFRPNYD